MRIDLTKTSHILFFVVLLPAISWSIGWLFAYFFVDVPFWVEGVSPLGAYAMLYAGFNRFAWAWPIFRLTKIVSAPDVRGRWVGEQQSSYRRADGRNATFRSVLEIEQTFSDITVNNYYQRWQSNCDGSFMMLDGQLYLVVLFEAEPNSKHKSADGAHKGVMRLRYIPKDRTLAGTYFNSNGNYGEVTYTRSKGGLLRRFDKNAL